MKKFCEWAKTVYVWSTLGCFLGAVMFAVGFITGCYFKDKELKEKEEE